MDLQNVFYVVSIFFMLAVVSAVVSMAVAVNSMKNHMIALRHDITNKFEDFKEKTTSQLSTSSIATTLLTFGLRKIFRR